MSRQHARTKTAGSRGNRKPKSPPEPRFLTVAPVHRTHRTFAFTATPLCLQSTPFMQPTDPSAGRTASNAEPRLGVPTPTVAPDGSCPFHDPFRQSREQDGVLVATFQGQPIPMLLKHQDIRAAAANWRVFSSDAPFRVPIPSEEQLRSVRQLPIETNPPEHTEYRRIIEPFFQRPKDPEMIGQVERLVGQLLSEAAGRASIEIVREFALPLQSRALACLLNVPEAEADEWISWGIHVFRDGPNGEAKGARLERYIHARLDRAQTCPGEDFFSALVRATYRGRPLSREEMVGFVNLTFAGGRDTMIQTVAFIIGYLGDHPDALTTLRSQPALIHPATEEFFRVLSPLTHIGRVCPEPTSVKDHAVAAGERVSFCWASANRDASVFEDPDELRLARKPNPHIAFGSGPHTCIGALHARLVARTLLKQLCERIATIRILASEAHWEREASYQRQVGYDSLNVSLVPRDAADATSPAQPKPGPAKPQ